MSSPQFLFIDTEFTDFVKPELISIGIVSEDGVHEFYSEVNNFRVSACSEFTKMNVLPLLDLQRFGKTETELSARLYCWSEDIGEEYVLFPDNKVDWDLTLELLEDIPSNIKAEPMMLHTELSARITKKAKELQTPDYKWFYESAVKQFNEGFLEYFLRNPTPKQHHSLADAKANRTGWKKTLSWLNQYY